VKYLSLVLSDFVLLVWQWQDYLACKKFLIQQFLNVYFMGPFLVWRILEKWQY